MTLSDKRIIGLILVVSGIAIWKQITLEYRQKVLMIKVLEKLAGER
jgi:cytochrome b subunit of formate dehydrogenase